MKPEEEEKEEEIPNFEKCDLFAVIVFVGVIIALVIVGLLLTSCVNTASNSDTKKTYSRDEITGERITNFGQL